MSIPSSAVAQFRGLWADRFIDTVTVKGVAARGTFNPSTLVYDSGSDTSKYSGKALIRPADSQDNETVGGDERGGELFRVFLPHDAGTFDLEDTVGVSASVWDTGLAGKELRVVAFTYDSYLTRIKLLCRMDQGVGYA